MVPARLPFKATPFLQQRYVYWCTPPANQGETRWCVVAAAADAATAADRHSSDTQSNWRFNDAETVRSVKFVLSLLQAERSWYWYNYNRTL